MMKTVSLAARRWYVSTWIASGARPIAAPPLTMSSFAPSVISGAALLYVCLHGLPGQPYWYGSDWATVVSAEQIRGARLDGAIVYLAGCYGQGPMTDALLAAGAAAVVGDEDSTWAGYVLPTGSNALGRRFVRHLKAGLSAGAALDRARAEYAATGGDPRAPGLLATVGLAGDAGATLQGV